MVFAHIAKNRPLLLLTKGKGSSLYRPKLSFSINDDNFYSKYIRTILHISASSKIFVLIATWKGELPRYPSLLNSSSFLASLIASITLSPVVIMDLT